MRLDESTSEREPVVFDLNSLPEGYRRSYGLVPAFAFGRASFEDELHTAVACNNGINETGELDMTLLSTVEQVSEYLRDKQGQPLLLVNVARKPDSEDIVYISGYVATVDKVLEPVGIDKRPSTSDGAVRAGIAVTNAYTSLHGSFFEPGKSYASQYLTDTPSALIPFRSSDFWLGRPAWRDSDDDTEITQEIVAGKDIVPWIEATFDGNNAYTFYMDVVQSVLRHLPDNNPHDAIDPLLVEPFVSAARHELGVLSEISETLMNYAIEIDDQRAVMEGIRAVAQMKLRDLEGKLGRGGLRRPTPVTSDSYPAVVTGRLDSPSGEQLSARQKAIDWYTSTLGKLVTRANQQS